MRAPRSAWFQPRRWCCGWVGGGPAEVPERSLPKQREDMVSLLPEASKGRGLIECNPAAVCRECRGGQGLDREVDGRMDCGGGA